MELSLGAVAPPLIGGVLIGIASCALLLLNGRLAGISVIFAGSILGSPDDVAWRRAFVVGLLTGGVATTLVAPASIATHGSPLPVLAAAGLLVGFGTRLGNGCTSGHGVCGLGRFSPRGLVATLTFIATGALTVALVAALS